MIYLGFCILAICLIIAFTVDIGYMLSTIFSAVIISCGVICFTVCLVGEFILAKLKFMNDEDKDTNEQESTEQK